MRNVSYSVARGHVWGLLLGKKIKIKTTRPDKLLSRYPATLISKCPPKTPQHSIQYIKVVVKYCRVGNKAHNN